MISRIVIEGYDGEVNNGQEIDVPLCDWITGLEVLTDHGGMWFELVDVNGSIMTTLPHVATWPKGDEITGAVEHYCGPYPNRSGACPVILRVHTRSQTPVRLKFVVKGINER